jgi:hypothetical protein
MRYGGSGFAKRLERIKQLSAAARRRAAFERWREQYQNLLMTPARSADERAWKIAALEQHEAQHPHHQNV